jgi:hypothetical protein
MYKLILSRLEIKTAAAEKFSVEIQLLSFRHYPSTCILIKYL